MAQFNQALQVPLECRGMRIDQVVAQLVPQFSRAQLQQWLKSGQIRVNGQLWQAKTRVSGGEQVILAVVLSTQTEALAQAIPLHIVYEDEQLLVVNKPAGLVVHPAAGHREGTLLNALLHHDPQLAQLPRAGIVHRLDKDTTGLLVVARTAQAQTALVRQLQQRTVGRTYDAIVIGSMVSGGVVNEAIGRHSHDRKKFAVDSRGKEALTHYRVVQRFRAHTHIKLKLETGRTHQIRVHMAHIRYPLVGDPVYSGHLPKHCSAPLIAALREFKRQALHASELSLIHPTSQDILEWNVPLPEDMVELLEVLNVDLTGVHTG